MLLHISITMQVFYDGHSYHFGNFLICLYSYLCSYYCRYRDNNNTGHSVDSTDNATLAVQTPAVNFVILNQTVSSCSCSDAVGNVAMVWNIVLLLLLHIYFIIIQSLSR